ncbi:MAG: hypothetical protein ACJAWW_002048 [Sulfurimonas sp.]|jgi:hypothetical protein
MRYILTILTFSLLFLGCADKNAFSKFKMLPDQELSANSLQSSKIKLGENVAGVVSTIYLNEIYPKVYTANEYFYVYVYLKDGSKMYDPNTLDDIKLTLKLNNKLPLKIKKLDSKNKFSHLASVNSEWNQYFLIAFEEEKTNKLSLVLENGQSSSDSLVYQKGE